MQKNEDAPIVAKVRLRRKTPEYSVSVIVEPANDHAYALAVSETAENRLAVKGEGLVETISTVESDCECDSSPCSYSYPCEGSYCCDSEEDNGKYLEWPELTCEPYRDSDGNCQCECDTYCSGKDDCTCECIFTRCTCCSCW